VASQANRGGWVDTALTIFAMNTFLALPGILLAIAFAAFLGRDSPTWVLALAIGGWPAMRGCSGGR